MPFTEKVKMIKIAIHGYVINDRKDYHNIPNSLYRTYLSGRLRPVILNYKTYTQKCGNHYIKRYQVTQYRKK
jgi:hypothetical protein